MSTREVFLVFVNNIPPRLGEAKLAAQKLNGAWLLDFHIGVNLARFNARSDYWRKVDPISTASLRRSWKQMSAEAEKRSPMGNGVEDAQGVLDKISKCKVCVAKVEVEALHRLEKCLIGVASDFYEADFLLEKINFGRLGSVSMKKISGKHFILEFEDDATRLLVLNGEWYWLKEWFSDIFPWSLDFSVKSRTLWLYYFNRGAILILTEQPRRIDELIELDCEGKSYLVRVYEMSSEEHFFYQWSRKSEEKSVNAMVDSSVVGDSFDELQLVVEQPFLLDKENSLVGDNNVYREEVVAETEVGCMGIINKNQPLELIVNDFVEVTACMDDEERMVLVGKNPSLKVRPNREGVVSSSESVSINGLVSNLHMIGQCVLGKDLVGDPKVHESAQSAQNSFSLVNAKSSKIENSLNRRVSCLKSIELSVGERVERPLNSGSELNQDEDAEDVIGPAWNTFEIGVLNRVDVVGSGDILAYYLSCQDEPSNLMSAEINSKDLRKSLSFEEKPLNNKRGSKTLVEIEDKILENFAKKGKRRGRKKKIFFKSIQVEKSSGKIVNVSLSDSDFRNRKEILRREAKDTWEFGKMLGLSVNYDDNVVIEELMKMSNRD
ncbi:hypothetical protein REPUB_Repub13aG0087900 [Reevesia pubescens]